MGIEEVYDIDQFRIVYRRIRSYALRQFKDEGVLIEQRITGFNHLEVQIVGDRHGHIVHFGTRNCSIQSTGLQKRIEVAPGFAPGFVEYDFDAEALLDEITRHSLALAELVGYDSVGTWEWIVTSEGKPFLMEVNTRIQVENGVSAAIARVNGKDGVDLIAEQIRLGLGQELGYTQDDIAFDGVGIEYRIIAENPAANFAPWVGCIDKFTWKDEPWQNVYTHVPTALSGVPYDIPTDFDPNLALGIIWGKDLPEVKERGCRFLDSIVLDGHTRSGSELESNIGFLRANTDRLLQFRSDKVRMS
jgi:acetyl/propionyl-CoA carboxylase alpha subunit